jgi:hypothetical protein
MKRREKGVEREVEKGGRWQARVVQTSFWDVSVMRLRAWDPGRGGKPLAGRAPDIKPRCLRHPRLRQLQAKVVVSFGMGSLSKQWSFPRKRESSPSAAYFQQSLSRYGLDGPMATSGLLLHQAVEFSAPAFLLVIALGFQNPVHTTRQAPRDGRSGPPLDLVAIVEW